MAWNGRLATAAEKKQLIAQLSLLKLWEIWGAGCHEKREQIEQMNMREHPDEGLVRFG